MSTLRERLISLGATAMLASAGMAIATAEAPGGRPNLTPYDDIGGVRTWCYGETAGTPKGVYTVAECDQQLMQSVQQHWDGIAPFIPREAPQSVKESMLVLAYNTGVAGWKWEGSGSARVPSRFRVALAKHDWEGTCRAITAPWRGKYGVAKGYKATARGKPSRGLENRRAKEAAICRRDLP